MKKIVTFKHRVNFIDYLGYARVERKDEIEKFMISKNRPTLLAFINKLKERVRKKKLRALNNDFAETIKKFNTMVQF